MQYIEHDFFNNYKSAYSSKDAIFVKDILTDEIAKLIAHDRVRVIQALNNAKIPVDLSISNTALGKLVNSNVSKNETLRKNIIALVIDNNGGAKDGLRITGGKEQPSNNGTMSKILDSGLKMSFNGNSFNILGSRISQHMTQRKYMNRYNFDANDDSSNKANKTAKIITFTVLGTAVAIVGTYFLIKYLKKPSESEGMASAPIDSASASASSSNNSSASAPIDSASVSASGENVTWGG